jgi:hypothetical protein
MSRVNCLKKAVLKVARRILDCDGGTAENNFAFGLPDSGGQEFRAHMVELADTLL